MASMTRDPKTTVVDSGRSHELFEGYQNFLFCTLQQQMGQRSCHGMPQHTTT
jgi:hypothetical protein